MLIGDIVFTGDMSLFEWLYHTASSLISMIQSFDFIGFLNTPVPCWRGVAFDGLLPIIEFGTVPLIYLLLISSWQIVIYVFIVKFFFGAIADILKFIKSLIPGL